MQPANIFMLVWGLLILAAGAAAAFMGWRWRIADERAAAEAGREIPNRQVHIGIRVGQVMMVAGVAAFGFAWRTDTAWLWVAGLVLLGPGVVVAGIFGEDGERS